MPSSRTGGPRDHSACRTDRPHPGTAKLSSQEPALCTALVSNTNTDAQHGSSAGCPEICRSLGDLGEAVHGPGPGGSPEAGNGLHPSLEPLQDPSGPGALSSTAHVGRAGRLLDWATHPLLSGGGKLAGSGGETAPALRRSHREATSRVHG